MSIFYMYICMYILLLKYNWRFRYKTLWFNDSLHNLVVTTLSVVTIFHCTLLQCYRLFSLCCMFHLWLISFIIGSLSLLILFTYLPIPHIPFHFGIHQFSVFMSLFLFLFEIPHVMKSYSICLFCLISLGITHCRFIHVVTDDKILLFLWLGNIPFCIYATSLSIGHLGYFLYFGYCK